MRIRVSDGRLFLKSTPQKFDVIVLNLPEPQTAQINRFYTVEFFREAAAKLNPGGVLSFQLVASEDVITATLASFLQCIDHSLREVFPEISTIPGEKAHFFASKQAGTLTDQADELLRRLKSRHLQTSYVREYYLPFRMSPDRVSQLAEQIRPGPETPVNHDFAPIAYYFDVALWSTQFNERYREIFESMAHIRFVRMVCGLTALLAATVVLSVIVGWRQFQASSIVGCVGAMGFTLMALEGLLLLGFQAIYGYVYQQLALLIAAVMMGMALGSWLGLRRIEVNGSRTKPVTFPILAAIQVLAALSPLLLYGFFVLCAPISSHAGLLVVGNILFPAVGLVCGMLGGYQFPLASSLFFSGKKNAPQNAGSLYAVDLLGACAGAIILSAYLVPVFGFQKTAMLIFVLNLATALLAFTAASLVEKPPV